MIYKARNKSTCQYQPGKTVLLCEDCIKDDDDGYRYGDWHDGLPQPVTRADVEGSGDFSMHLDGYLPCNSCGKDLHDETNEAV